MLVPVDGDRSAAALLLGSLRESRVQKVAKEDAGFRGANYWLSQVGAKVERDWLGRDAVDVRDAERAERAFRQAAEDAAELQSKYDRYLRGREQQREAAAAEAAQKALLEAVKVERERMMTSGTFYLGLPASASGAGFRYAAAAAAEARVEFDRGKPLLTFQEFERKERNR